jgi:hypothetical protein
MRVVLVAIPGLNPLETPAAEEALVQSREPTVSSLLTGSVARSFGEAGRTYPHTVRQAIAACLSIHQPMTSDVPHVQTAGRG